MTHETNRLPTLPIAASLLLSVLLSAPLASATYPFGSPVASEDADYVPKAASVNVAVCFLDDDGSGAHEAGEDVFLMLEDTTCSEVMPEDLPLQQAGGVGPGEEISASSSLYTKPVSNASHAVRYFDADGDGEFAGADDNLYLDLGSISASQVSPGDIRLTPARDQAAATVVQSGDPDMSDALNDLGASQTRLWENDVFYEAGDGYYLNADLESIGDTDIGPEADDVRLNAGVPGDDGQPAIAVDDVFVTPANATPGQPVRIHIDVTNTGDPTGAGEVRTQLGTMLVDVRGTPTLDPGESTTLVLTLPVPGQVGTHEITAGDQTTTVTVNQPTHPTEAPQETKPGDEEAEQTSPETEETATTSSSEPTGETDARNESIQTESTDATPPSSTQRSAVPSLSAGLMLVALAGSAFTRRTR